MNKKLIFFSLLAVLIYVSSSEAQLNQAFDRIFNQVLKDDLTLSPGVHGTHFFEAAALANRALTPALNSLVASNVSSFPLSSTAAGVTFDFSSGQPVSITESLGPIFAEAAQTLGKGKINIGFNYTKLNLAKLRGLATEDIRFTFTHQDVTGDGTLGESPNESDIIDLFLDLDASANIFAFFGTLGVTDNFDLGLAIPIVDLSLSGTATAIVNSYTFGNLGTANHRFNADGASPDLVDTIPYDERATGVGDLALRLKYSFLRGADMSLAALLDIRFPTGDEEDFLGTGKTNARLSWIMSRKIGDFSPHLNIGYDRRGAELDSDEFEFTVGFDQKVATGVTFAADFLGEFDLNGDEAIELFPGNTTIVDVNTTTQARNVRQVDLSNIPERDNDNTLNASLGFRVAPSERLLFLGNILVPLNDGGLRSSVAPTLGLTVSF